MAAVKFVHAVAPSAIEVLVRDYLAHCRQRGLAPSTIRTAYRYTLDDVFLPWSRRKTSPRSRS